MELPRFLRNLGSLLLCLLLLMAVSLSCTMVKGVAGLNDQSKELNEFYYNVPFGYENAEPDPGAWHESSFVVLMPDSERMFVGKMDSPPVDIAKLGEAVKAFTADKTPDKKAVYIAAANYVSKNAITRVLDELRKQDIETARLLVSSAERRKGISGDDTKYEESMGDIPKPDRIIEIGLRPPPIGDKPNPLTLTVTVENNDAVTLNNESDLELISRLADIFKQRELNDVRRAGTNEIEKTVFFRVRPKGVGEVEDSSKYKFLIDTLDKIKASGASPIIYIDENYLMPVWINVHGIDRSPIPEVSHLLNAGILNGKATSLPKPPYPPAARAVRAAGAVHVQVTVDTKGKVVEARAVTGHPLLRSAAEQAARMATFSPTIVAGVPVKVTGVITYNFTPE